MTSKSSGEKVGRPYESGRPLIGLSCRDKYKENKDIVGKEKHEEGTKRSHKLYTKKWT